LGAKSGNARARDFGKPSVICIGDHFEQSLDTAAPDRSMSRDRLVAFAFAAAELLVELAQDSSITWAAGAFQTRFGEPAERFVGRKLSSLIAPADHDALGRTLIGAALSGHMPPVMPGLVSSLRIGPGAKLALAKRICTSGVADSSSTLTEAQTREAA